MSPGFSQHIPEQHGLQLTGRDLRFLDGGVQGQGLAGLGAVQGALHGVHIKISSGLFRNDRAGGGIVGGVLHLAVELVVELLGGLCFGGEGLRRQFHHGFCFGTVLDHILNCAAQFIIRNKAAVSGGGDLKGVIDQLVRHIKRFNIQYG